MSKLQVEVEPESFGVSSERLTRIKPHFDRYVEDRRLAGWLATISRGGELIWSDKGGYRDREKELSVEDDTIWRIYSMTKPVTAIAVMMLYEEGLFDLLDPAGKWIDSLRESRVFSGGSSMSPKTVPALGPVRIHHLLTHMSGLTYGFQYIHPVDAIYRKKGYDFAFKPGADLAEAVDDWCTSPLVFQPGTRWNYSVAFDVLGRLIELWSGQTLDVFMKERIFDPLGMGDTEWWCPPDRAERLAMLYVPVNREAVAYEPIAKAAFHPPALLGGGGGLFSTAYDYGRFTSMLLSGGELDGVRLLSSRTIDLMTQNHLPGDVDLETIALDSFSEFGYAGVGFGLGMSVITDQRKNKSLCTDGSFGWGGAASTAFWVDPNEDLTVGFYTQLLPSTTYPIRRDLQRLVYQALID
ncbi:MAG: serine hydrolase domain-containing protein [Acidimicrobiales bacterium]